MQKTMRSSSMARSIASLIVAQKPRTDGAKIMDFAGYAGAIAYIKGWSN